MRELNWKPGQSATLSVLSEDGAAASSAPVRILEFSGTRMRLNVATGLKGGAAVRLDCDGQLLLGEVLNAAPDGVWVEIHHMLLDGGGLNWQKAGWQRG